MNFIYEWPIVATVALILALSIAATELGFRYGIRERVDRSDRDFAMTTGLKASIIGLVALLLGFSFSITSSRFSERTRIVMEEANTISTCYDRAGLVAEPARGQIRDALRRYTVIRIDYFKNALDDAAFARTSADMNVALAELWSGVTKAVQADPQLANTSQIVAGANEVMDIAEMREWSMLNRLPASVVVLLAVCMVISGALVGHSSAEAGERHPGLWIALNVLIMLVVFVILDFDRPRRGLIQISQRPLVEVLEEMRR